LQGYGFADGREAVLDEPRPWWGWLRLQFAGFNKRIDLTAVPRHFGGRQWYWLCPTKYVEAVGQQLELRLVLSEHAAKDCCGAFASLTR